MGSWSLIVVVVVVVRIRDVFVLFGYIKGIFCRGIGIGCRSRVVRVGEVVGRVDCACVADAAGVGGTCYIGSVVWE
jgi:hypothetical protein